MLIGERAAFLARSLVTRVIEFTPKKNMMISSSSLDSTDRAKVAGRLARGIVHARS